MDPGIHAKIKEHVPLTWQSSKRETPPIRKLIKSRLYCDDNIPTSELDYMREHPEDLEWLKAHIRPRFRQKCVTEVNANRPPGVPDTQG